MIQPIDIKTQSFKKSLFGYRASDVDGFKDTIYRAYDDIFKQNADLSNKLEKMNASLESNRIRIFELENEIQKMENVSSYDEDDNLEAKKKAEQIIKNAEAAAAEIIAKAKAQSEKLENAAQRTETASSIKVEPVPDDEPVKESASSRFFKKAEEEAPAASSMDDDDDDEIFVGEIEDARKPDRMMIGDGEEEEDMDFEFL